MILDDNTLLSYLKEDAPYGDLTSRSLTLPDGVAMMRFQARGDMTLCGVEEAGRLLALIGCQVKAHGGSGDRLKAGQLILEASGTAEQLLLGWKVAQMLMEWSSGVATATSRLVANARAVNPAVVVACTRKAIPGTRILSAKAVLAGGASLHRTGLSDTLLLFPEHRNLSTAGADALAQQIAQLKTTCPERSLVVEVKTQAEALAAAESDADVLQLEKFPLAEIQTLMQDLPADNRPKIAVAGGIHADNAADFAATGVEVLVTSWPYYAKPADVQVVIGQGL